MKSLYTITRSTALLALVTSFTALNQTSAQQGERPGPGRIADMLKQADTDNDGKISREEFIKMRTQESSTQFDRMDTNGDGFIDETEVAALAGRARPEGRGGEGAPRPEGDRPPRRGAPESAPETERPARPEGGERPTRGDAERPARPEGGERPTRGAAPEGGARPGFGGGGGLGGGLFTAEMFDTLDTDGDGKLSKEEYEKGATVLADRLRQGMQQRGGPGGRERVDGMERGERAPGAPGTGGFRRPPNPEGSGNRARPESE